MLHVYYGADDFRSSEALAALRASLDDDGMLSTNTSVLAGQGLTQQVLTQHATAVPFLAGARLVIAEGLLTALGSRRGLTEEWRPFIDSLPLLPPSNHLVLIEPVPRSRDNREGVGRSPLLRLLRNVPDADIVEFGELKTWGRDGPSEVGRWLHARAQERGIAIEDRAIDALVELMGANLRSLAQELDKLAAYSAARGEGLITAAHVDLLTPLARDENIFAIVDAIVEGRADQSLQLLRRVLNDGSVAPGYLQVMVARQLRHLVRATELLERHASQQEIADATGLRGGFPLTKLMRQARLTSSAAAEANLRDLEAADFSVKTGRMSDELALELVVCRLAARASKAGRRRTGVG
jgi:DNA polymerase III delta subunit